MLDYVMRCVQTPSKLKGLSFPLLLEMKATSLHTSTSWQFSS